MRSILRPLAVLAVTTSFACGAHADPPAHVATTAARPAASGARAEGPALPQGCEQDPFHVDYGAIREGTLVRLGRHRSVEGNANWDPSMEHYVGRVTPVVSARGLDPQGCPIVEVAADGGEYVWRVRDLVVVAAATPSEDGPVPEIRLTQGLVPDPQVYEAQLAELSRPASSVKNGCAGWLPARPTFTLLLQDDFPTLSVMARARFDSVLVVRMPSGEFVCVDDVDDRDPVLTGRAPAGRYEIYVGAYEATAGSAQVRIGLSERSTVHAAALDDVAPEAVRPLRANDARPTGTRLQPGRPTREPASRRGSDEGASTRSR